MPERPPTIPERIEASAGEEPPEGIPVAPDSWRSPEDGAEQLYALWRDYNRRKVGVYRKAIERYHQAGGKTSGVEGKTPDVEEPAPLLRSAPRIPTLDRAALMASVDADPSLALLREAIRVRFRVPDIRQAFEQSITRIQAQGERIQPTRAAYAEEQQRYDAARSRELDIYRTIFSHRDREPDELSLLELADLHTRITAGERTMDTAERANPELAAQLSFERLRQYRDELTHGGFVWTPSREQYFDQILEHLVVLDQNRPVLLTGETGTGKTRLARAVAERLTGRAPFEVGEEAKSDIRPLLGTPQMDKEGSYVAYGPLGQALTGKATSRDQESDGGGICFLDEANGYPPDGHRAVIKQIAGRNPGEEVGFAAWRGKRERIAEQFGLIESANLPSPKHPDRQPLPVEITRELTTLTVEYPPQTPDDPELYEMFLAACLDQNDRLRIPKDEVAPKWNDVVDTATNTKRQELDTAPAAGGALWRFASIVADIQRAYTGQENALTPTKRNRSYLKVAVLDVGLPISWLQEYRKTSNRRGEPLHRFLAHKLTAWADQATFPESDRNLLTEFFSTYSFCSTYTYGGGSFPTPDRTKEWTLLSPSEIGALSPRVPRAPEFLTATPDIETANATLEDGTIVKYRPLPFGDVYPGARFSPSHGEGEREGVGIIYTFRGLTVGDDHTPAGSAILEGPDGIAKVIAPDALTTDFERERSERITATVRADAITSIPAERGKEVTLDLQEVLDSSLAFLDAKAPPSWAQSLREEFPHGITLTPEQRTTIERAMEYGFTRVLLIPSADIQGITTVDKHDPADPTKTIPTLISPSTLRTATDHLLTTCVTDPVPGLPVEDQYTAPHIYEPEKTKVPTLRKGAPARTRPYFVFVGPGSIPENLKNLTFSDADAALARLANDLRLPTLTGCTTPERLLHQRREVEHRAPLTPAQRTATYGDSRPHAFDAYRDTATESNWTWDLDSRVPGGCSRGGWSPGGRQSGLHWNDASYRFPGLGARPAVVVEL